MPETTWYRAQVPGQKPAKTGGHIHDFADGLYLTDSEEIARKRYAPMREKGQSAKAQILHAKIQLKALGTVLDLRTDSRWNKFLRSQMTAKMTYGQFLKRNISSEQYNAVFQAFLRQNNLKLADFDAVIGPDYISGKGNQLCVLHNNGRGVKLIDRVRRWLRPVAPRVTSKGVVTYDGESNSTGKESKPNVSSKTRLLPRGKLKGFAKAMAGSVAMVGVSVVASWLRKKLDERVIKKQLKQLEPKIAEQLDEPWLLAVATRLKSRRRNTVCKRHYLGNIQLNAR